MQGPSPCPRGWAYQRTRQTHCHLPKTHKISNVSIKILLRQLGGFLQGVGPDCVSVGCECVGVWGVSVCDGMSVCGV